MTKDERSTITGITGENLAATLLGRIANVSPYRKDRGLDFQCELWDYPARGFFVQAKGSENPTYTHDGTRISSLPVSCKTIEEYWLIRAEPVFVLMSDTTTTRTFYLIVNRDTFKPSLGQKTYTFSIPIENEITHENVGDFFQAVIENDPRITQEEIEQHLNGHYQKYPELYHDLDEIERFLEVMRGSDQAAQAEVAMIVKQQIKEGKPLSLKLKEGLKSIFINCKNNVTQQRVLDILILLGDRDLVREILNQLHRNIHLYDFKPYGYEKGRSTYTDFLFAALVKLEATNISTELTNFLKIKDLTINRGAIRACGDLAVNSSIPEILPFLRHKDEGIRHDAIQALSKLNHARVKSELNRVVQAPRSELELAGAILGLDKYRDSQTTTTILPFAKHPTREVRKAVASYLGAVGPAKYIESLLQLVVDTDHQVRAEARRSISKCHIVTSLDELPPSSAVEELIITLESLESLVLPMLKEAYANNRSLEVLSLLPFCRGPKTRSVLVDIYLQEEDSTTQIEFRDPAGASEGISFVNLKTRILDILKQYDLPIIHRDVVSNLGANSKYAIAAGEMQLEAAFEPLTRLITSNNTDTNDIVNALVRIDTEKAKAWSIERLKTHPPLNVSLACFSILHSTDTGRTHSGLVKAQIVSLMDDPEVRSDGRVYLWIGQYDVKEVVPLIIEDLETNFETLGVVRYRMLETVMGLAASSGRDMLIEILPKVDDGWKGIILECLAAIDDTTALEVIKEYEGYPSFGIDKIVERILSKTDDHPK